MSTWYVITCYYYDDNSGTPFHTGERREGSWYFTSMQSANDYVEAMSRRGGFYNIRINTVEEEDQEGEGVDVEPYEPSSDTYGGI